MEHPIGTLPRTPFPASRDFPSRGNEGYEEKNSDSYTSRTISAFSLFGGCRHHLVRREEIEAALVMGWPLDSVILNAVKNLGAWRG